MAEGRRGGVVGCPSSSSTIVTSMIVEVAAASVATIVAASIVAAISSSPLFHRGGAPLDNERSMHVAIDVIPDDALKNEDRDVLRSSHTALAQSTEIRSPVRIESDVVITITLVIHISIRDRTQCSGELVMVSWAGSGWRRRRVAPHGDVGRTRAEANIPPGIYARCYYATENSEIRPNSY